MVNSPGFWPPVALKLKEAIQALLRVLGQAAGSLARVSFPQRGGWLGGGQGVEARWVVGVEVRWVVEWRLG